MRRFQNPPTIIRAADAGRLEINFFPQILPDIADVQIVRRAIKLKPPWIA